MTFRDLRKPPVDTATDRLARLDRAAANCAAAMALIEQTEARAQRRAG